MVWLQGRKWEIDVFEDELTGKMLAEVEIPHEGYSLIVPPGIGKEVTMDPRYSNISLGKNGWPVDV